MVFRVPHDCSGQWVFAPPLDCRDERDDLAFRQRRIAGRSDPDVCDVGPALCDRARLVQHNSTDFLQTLENLATLDQNSKLGSTARGDHHSSGNSQAHSARAGNDEYRYGSRDRLHNCVGRDKEPNYHRQDREAKHDRHKDRAHLVREFLNRCFDGLRLSEKTHDLREGAAAPSAVAS